MPSDARLNPVNPQKARTGLSRVWHAGLYSLAGLRAGWREPAFRQEAILAVVLVPLSFWLGRSWVEVVMLAGSVLLATDGMLVKRPLLVGDDFVLPGFKPAEWENALL